MPQISILTSLTTHTPDHPPTKSGAKEDWPNIRQFGCQNFKCWVTILTGDRRRGGGHTCEICWGHPAPVSQHLKLAGGHKQSKNFDNQNSGKFCKIPYFLWHVSWQASGYNLIHYPRKYPTFCIFDRNEPLNCSSSFEFCVIDLVWHANFTTKRALGPYLGSHLWHATWWLGSKNHEACPRLRYIHVQIHQNWFKTEVRGLRKVWTSKSKYHVTMWSVACGVCWAEWITTTLFVPGTFVFKNGIKLLHVFQELHCTSQKQTTRLPR